MDFEVGDVAPGGGDSRRAALLHDALEVQDDLRAVADPRLARVLLAKLWETTMRKLAPWNADG